MDKAHQSWYSSKPLSPSTETAFIDLRSMPARLSFCKNCACQYCSMGNLAHYPVRLPKGDVFCYSCATEILNRYSEGAESKGLKTRISKARESIDSQVRHCCKALEMEEQRWLFAQIPAARRLQVLKGEAC